MLLNHERKQYRIIKEPLEDDPYTEDLKTHRDLSQQRADYALKRLDVVVIALSSSALVLIGSLLKDNQEYKQVLVLLMWPFVLAILSNILSQWYGYLSNSHETMAAFNNVVLERRNRVYNKLTLDDQNSQVKMETLEEGLHSDAELRAQVRKSERLAGNFGDRTNTANIISTALLAFGILALVGLLTFWAYYPAPSL